MKNNVEKRLCEVRVARLALWLDGQDEFPVSFEDLDDSDKIRVRRTLGMIIELLDAQIDEVDEVEQFSNLRNPENR